MRKPIILGLVAGASALGIAIAVFNLFAPWKQAQAVKNLGFTTLAGAPVHLSDYHGKPIVVNLWATWCPPCRREMPALEQAQNDNPNIHFLFINQREDQELILRYLQEQNLNLKNVLLDDQGDMAKEAKSTGLPTTLFLNSQGKLVDFRLGELSLPALNTHLAALQSK